MPGDIGLVSQAINTLFSWFTSEDGLAEVQKRMKGTRLEKECASLWGEYKRLRTPESRAAYDAKHQEMVDFSNAL